MKYIFTLCMLAGCLLMATAAADKGYDYHIVAKGETLYSIARQYGLKPIEVIRYNDDASGPLQVGQKIKLPAGTAAAAPKKVESSTTAATPAPAPTKTESKVNPLFDYGTHVVKKGETFYSICRLYGMKQDELLTINKMKDNTILVGQHLKVIGEGNEADANINIPAATGSATKTNIPGNDPATRAAIEKAIKENGYAWTLPESTLPKDMATATASASATGAAGMAGMNHAGTGVTSVGDQWHHETIDEIRNALKTKEPADQSSEYESLYYQYVYSGMSKKIETGFGKVMTENNNANIVFYNNAAVGSILKLTNPSNGKTAYAIVVGKVAEGESSYLVKVSSHVARNLSASDYSRIEVCSYSNN